MCCGPAPIFGVLSVTPAAAATARKPFLFLVGTARAVSTVLLSLLSPTPTPCLQGHLLHVQDPGSGHSSCLQDKQTQHGTQRGACSAHFRFLFCLSCQKPSPWPRPQKAFASFLLLATPPGLSRLGSPNTFPRSPLYCDQGRLTIGHWCLAPMILLEAHGNVLNYFKIRRK